MNDQQKIQIAERLNQSNNILVTVSTNPSVDQLAACIGLTLALNKMGKHAAAVFSGKVPNTIEFLQPEKTIEKNTDSLRDFIISLDKAKADKLRYKVEDKVVKIFITPYKTSISDKDLEFSQGDFNVDVVVAIGVHSQADIDQAITAHGRILHDAVVTTINVTPGGELGAINWLNTSASSLSELVVQLLDATKQKIIDGQMATAFLTGIVAETERFSNNRTTPQTMTISAELMAAGANQQLVATKLEPPKPKPVPVAPPVAPEHTAVKESKEPSHAPAELKIQATTKPADGTLEISHMAQAPTATSLSDLEDEESNDEEKLPPTPQIDIDREGTLRSLADVPPPANAEPPKEGQRKILQPQDAPPATMPGLVTDPLSLPQPTGGEERPSGAPPLPHREEFGTQDSSTPLTSSTSAAPPLVPPTDNTLAPRDGLLPGPQLSPTTAAPVTPISPLSPPPPPPAPLPPEPVTNPMGSDVSGARDAVTQAIGSQPSVAGTSLPPITALNAMPLPPLHDDTIISPSGASPEGTVVGTAANPDISNQQTNDPNAPPPVPPPMIPPLRSN